MILTAAFLTTLTIAIAAYGAAGHCARTRDWTAVVLLLAICIGALTGASAIYLAASGAFV